MPEKFKALIVLLIIVQIVFSLLKPVYKEVLGMVEFNKIKYSVFIVNIISFSIGNYYIFVLFIAALSVFQSKNPKDRVLIYLSFILLLPILKYKIPGMLGMNNMGDITYPRLLVVFILIPSYFYIKKSSQYKAFFLAPSDKYVLGFILLKFLLVFHEISFTVALRSLFYYWLDIFIPYFVISRSIRNIGEFKQCIIVILTALFIMANVAIFESFKYWHLFSGMERDLIAVKGSDYATRSDLLRATASFTGPLVLGFMMNIGIGCLLILQDSFKNKRILILMFIIFFAGLITTYSRGAWLGCIVLLTIYALQGKNKFKKLIKGLSLLIVISLVIAVSPLGNKLYAMLPFSDNGEKHSVSTIDYRTKLLDKSLIVIYKKPFFGDINFMDDKDMQSLIQGQGIIDMVNSYLHIALTSGLVGLYLFLMIFYVNFRELTKLSKKYNNNLSTVIKGLISIMVSVAVIIATTSLVGRVPTMLWIFSGLITSLIMMNKNKNEQLG